VLDQGLHISTCQVSQPNFDPKRPTPDALLLMAFYEAGLEVSRGVSTDCGKYSLDIVVGRRPQKLGERPPILLRFARWLSSLQLQRVACKLLS